MTAETSKETIEKPYSVFEYSIFLFWVLFALGPILVENREKWINPMWVIVSALPVIILIIACVTGMIYSIKGKVFPKKTALFLIRTLLFCLISLPICLIIYYS